jgi:hypothetical protein
MQPAGGVLAALLVLALVLVARAVLVGRGRRLRRLRRRRPVPRRILMFWDVPDAMPTIAAQSIAHIRALHPGWSVDVLSDADVPADRDDVRALGPEHRADWMRLHSLSNGGGVWLDATCILVQPVTSWVDLDNAGGYGFYGFAPPWAGNNWKAIREGRICHTPPPVVAWPWAPRGRPTDVVENWAFAVPADGGVAGPWFREFDRAVRLGLDEYCRVVQPDLPDCLRGTGHLPYLTMHAAFAVLRTRGVIAARDVCSRPSGLPVGPFALHERLRWDADAVTAALDGWLLAAETCGHVMCKLRGVERRRVARLDYLA